MHFPSNTYRTKPAGCAGIEAGRKVAGGDSGTKLLLIGGIGSDKSP